MMCFSFKVSEVIMVRFKFIVNEDIYSVSQIM